MATDNLRDAECGEFRASHYRFAVNEIAKLADRKGDERSKTY